MEFFTILSGILIAIGYVSFIRSTLNGSMKPNSATWIVWFFQDGLMAASALAAGIGPSAVMPVVWFLGAAAMLPLSLKYGSKEPFTALEKTCLALSGLGILLWAATGSPLTALVASVTTVNIGGIPTVLKAWREPASESLVGWLLMLGATASVSLAVQTWTFESGFVPVTVGLFQTTIVLPLLSHALRK